jgi:protein-S-isoprenylcysteine O-methyltransferase Ste14
MTNATYLALVSLCLIGLAIRTRYELLKKSSEVDTKNPAVFSMVFAGMCLMLLSWPLLSLMDPLPLALPAAVRWVGLVSVVAGVVLAVGGLLQLRGLENIDHLVSGGLFAKLRHPMYTGFIAWILGWVVYRGAAASFAIALVCIANIHFWRYLEEHQLEAQFGDEYFRYREATWF